MCVIAFGNIGKHVIKVAFRLTLGGFVQGFNTHAFHGGKSSQNSRHWPSSQHSKSPLAQ
jgi:hypothetical protein